MLGKGADQDLSLHSFLLHKDAVTSLQLSEETLFSASYDTTICKLDLQKGLVISTFHGQYTPVHCIREKDGKIFAGNDNGTVSIIDAATGAEESNLAGHRAPVHCIWPEGDNLLYSGGADCNVRVWDIRKNKCMKKMKVHSGPVSTIQVANDSIFTTSWDGSIYIFKDGEGTRLTTPMNDSPPVLGMQIVAGQAYAAYRDGRVRVWELKHPEKPIGTYIAHDNPITNIMVDEDLRMYTASDDNTICVWDLKSVQRFTDNEHCLYTYKGHTDGVLCFAKSESLIYSGSFDHTIRIWDGKAVDRAVIPDLQEYAVPVHKLRGNSDTGGTSRGADALRPDRVDPDWWKLSKYVLGGQHIQPRIGVRMDQFVMAPTITEVFMGTAAQKAGLQEGDVILKFNDFEVPNVDLFSETIAYLKPDEEIEVILERAAQGSALKREVAINMIVEDPDRDVEDAGALVSVKQLTGGIFDVFNDDEPILGQAEHFHRVFTVHADFFRKMMFKFGVPQSPYMTLRSFWLLAKRCELVTKKISLAELDRLFVANRVRQLYPHPRTESIKSPHDIAVKLHLEDLLFGFARLASLKYSKVPEKHLKLERLVQKHLLPHALSDLPDILSEVGLGNLDQNVQTHHNRVLLKLFNKHSGMNCPVSAVTGDGFMQAIKSLQVSHGGTPDEFLRSVLAESQQLFLSKKIERTNEPDYEREMVPDEFLYGIALIGKRVCGAGSLSEVASEFIDRFIVGFVR